MRYEKAYRYVLVLVVGLVAGYIAGTAYAGIPKDGVISVHGCQGGVNESEGVGPNRAHEDLGVQCESGDGFRVVAR